VFTVNQVVFYKIFVYPFVFFWGVRMGGLFGVWGLLVFFLCDRIPVVIATCVTIHMRIGATDQSLAAGQNSYRYWHATAVYA